MARHSFVYGFGTIINRFFNLLSLPIFTNYLDTDEMGALAIVVTSGLFLQAIFGLGLSAAMGPFYFGDEEIDQKEKTIWSTFFIYIISATILILISWNFQNLISKLIGLNKSYSLLLSLSFTVTAINLLSNVFIMESQFQKRSKFYALSTTGSAGLSIIVGLFLVIIYKKGSIGVVLGQAISSIFLFFLVFALKSKKNIKFLSFKKTKSYLRLGLTFVPSFLFLFWLSNGNRYILEKYFKIEDVGIYLVGYNIGNAMNLFVGAFQTAWFPFYMQYLSNKKEAEKLFGDIFYIYFSVFGLITLLFFAMAKPITLLLVNENFYESHYVIGLSAAASFVMGIYSNLLPGLYFNKDIHVQSFIQGAAAVASFPISLFAIKEFGIIGAGYALFAGSILVVVFTVAWNFYKRSVYLKIIYDFKKIIFFCLFFGSFASLFLLLQSENPNEIFFQAFLGLCLILVYFFYDWKTYRKNIF